MRVIFNSEELHTEHSFLHQLLQEKKLIDVRGIAVALNMEVIQKANWTVTPLQENDNIIVITAAAGG